MKTLTWQKPGQQNVAQELIKIIINYVAELRIDKILVQVWRMFGLICMIFVLMATDLERYEVILPMGAIVMSMGSIITGCIIRYTTFFIFPAMGLMWGMKSFFDALNSGTSYVSLVWFTGVVVFAMIVPGHILNYKARKEVHNRK